MIGQRHMKQFSLTGVLAGTAMVLVLTVAPVSPRVDDGRIMIDSATAVAKEGNNGGNGVGHSGGHGNASKGGRGKSGKRFDLADGDGPGKGKAKNAAKARYAAALAKAAGRKLGKSDDDLGEAEYVLTDAEAEALVKQGWGARKQTLDDDFRNHGERVNFYKDLARALDLPNHFGSMWANFGDPFESGVADRLAAVDAAQANPEALEEAEDELAAAIAAAKPGNGPKTGWETAIEIDLSGPEGEPDGVVDEHDLEQALILAGASELPEADEDPGDGASSSRGSERAPLPVVPPAATGGPDFFERGIETCADV